MGRQAKKCPKKCVKHHFSLKPVHYSAYFSRETQFSFCPKNLKTEVNFPKFNKDRKAYTAAFILAVDSMKLSSNDQNYKMEHERFKKQNAQEKSQIYVPKPRSKSNYCSICRDYYQDYQEHIQSKSHLINIQNNPVEKNINELCQKFQLQHLVTLPEELPQSLASKVSIQTSFSSENQSLRSSGLLFEEPYFFLDKQHRDTFNQIGLCGSFKSIQNVQNNEWNEWEPLQNNLYSRIFQVERLRELEQRAPQGNLGFKLVSPTASPRKIKLERPIILTGKISLND